MWFIAIFFKKLKPDRKIYSKVTEGISNAHQSHELPETAHFYGGAQEQSLNHTWSYIKGETFKCRS